LIAFFIIEGIATIIFALESQSSTNREGRMLARGMVDLF